MHRRGFIGLVGGAAVWPLAARAQQSSKIASKVYRIAYAHPSAPTSSLSETGDIPYIRTFFGELRRLGYVEGQNYEMARYSGGGKTERYAELAQEVVRANPDVVVTVTSRMVMAFQAASNIIPVVASTCDPVTYGLAASLARPGGNFTGATSDTGLDNTSKRLELLKEAVPTLSTVGFLATPAYWASPLGLTVREAAPRLSIELVPCLLESHEAADYRRAFGAIVQTRVQAVLISDQSEHFTHRRLIAELAETGKLPTMSPWLDVVTEGGLMAYQPDNHELFRYLASCVDRILRGEKPGEIPILQSAKFKLGINLKAAKALGITIPAPLLIRADEVIE